MDPLPPPVGRAGLQREAWNFSFNRLATWELTFATAQVAARKIPGDANSCGLMNSALHCPKNLCSPWKKSDTMPKKATPACHRQQSQKWRHQPPAPTASLRKNAPTLAGGKKRTRLVFLCSRATMILAVSSAKNACRVRTPDRLVGERGYTEVEKIKILGSRLLCSLGRRSFFV